MKYKIAKEVAELEFVRLCEANRIDHDTTELSEEDKTAWQSTRAAVVRDLRIGTLIVGEDGKPTYTPPGASKGFTFKAATAATLISARAKKNNEIESMCVAMADMAGTPVGEFGKLDRIDFYACMRVANLFLGDQ